MTYIQYLQDVTSTHPYTYEELDDNNVDYLREEQKEHSDQFDDNDF